MKKILPIYHGQDLEAAKARAQGFGGIVLKSRAPDYDDHASSEIGYWSDAPDAPVRSWDQLIVSYAKGQSKQR